MTRITLAAFAVLLGLSACGGGDGQEASGTQKIQAIASVKQVTGVVFAGDSTFTGSPSSPDYAAAILAVPTENLAVSGTAVGQAPWASIQASHANVLVANYAINDSVGMSEADYRSGLLKLVQTATASGKATVLMEANPIVPGGSLSADRDDAAVKRYDAIKADVASQTGATYCKQPSLSWSLAFVPDGIHPGETARPYIGAAIASCVRSLIH